MSMLDAFFNKGFRGAKCKTLLKLTIPRIKLLRNKREVQLKQMRRDIAKLLETGQEATARIRVEHIMREENIMAAHEIIELFCELIVVRLPIIETQRECPLDLKEAISSLCFAAPRCADLPELQQVQMLFASKYGKEFVSAATELMPDCGVNRQIIELLSVRAPPAEAKLKLLKEIAEEHELDWDPTASETEYFKPHEDLLNGPSCFTSESKLPLPKEKHEDSTPTPISQEEPDSDTWFDSLDLPDVPKVSIQSNANSGSAPQMVPPLTASPDPNIDHETTRSSQTIEDISYELPSGPKIPSRTNEDKQFIPFMASPSFSGFSARQSNPAPTLLRTKSEGQVDFQDVLAAAQTAAETAERSAAAARSAASLAQLRISELTMKKNDPVSDQSGRSTFHVDNPHCPAVAASPEADQEQSYDDDASNTKHSSYPDYGMTQESVPSYETSKRELPSFDEPILPDHSLTQESETYYDETPMRVLSGFDEPVSGHQLSHRPQRSISMEEDPYFSYPNLFGSQDSNLRSDISSPAGENHDPPTSTSSK